MSVGHHDHVLIVYSLIEHVTWKSPGPMCGWVGRILHPDSCTSVSSWSKVPLLSIWSVAVFLCRPLLPSPSRFPGHVLHRAVNNQDVIKMSEVSTLLMFHIVESCPLTKLNGGLSRRRRRSVDCSFELWCTVVNAAPASAHIFSVHSKTTTLNTLYLWLYTFSCTLYIHFQRVTLWPCSFVSVLKRVLALRRERASFSILSFLSCRPVWTPGVRE